MGVPAAGGDLAGIDRYNRGRRARSGNRRGADIDCGCRAGSIHRNAEKITVNRLSNSISAAGRRAYSQNSCSAGRDAVRCGAARWACNRCYRRIVGDHRYRRTQNRYAVAVDHVGLNDLVSCHVHRGRSVG